MPMTYVDTSALVVMFAREARADALLSWLARHPRRQMCVSDWSVTEFASALAVKQRRGDLDEQAMADAWLEFDNACGSLLRVAPTSSEDFGNAARLCLQVDNGLRSGDALHLAVASRLACESLMSYDITLNKNAQAGGLAVIAP
jgi:uncharacterized protein